MCQIKSLFLIVFFSNFSRTVVFYNELFVLQQIKNFYTLIFFVKVENNYFI